MGDGKDDGRMSEIQHEDRVGGGSTKNRSRKRSSFHSSLSLHTRLCASRLFSSSLESEYEWIDTVNITIERWQASISMQ